MSLRLQRCARHADREAAARCPACGRSFCRECVTEHEGRWLCASCIAALPGGAPPPPRRSVLRAFARLCGAAAASCAWFLLLWGFYALFGALAGSVPHRFHDSSAFEHFLEGGP
ncbi:MAG: rhomboid family protein [Verrucomicrobiota bacterium]|jgi:ribosomal protein L37AE/L43A|nr:rhomboid family protein [Verrucomicrobiota bacterium]